MEGSPTVNKTVEPERSPTSCEEVGLKAAEGSLSVELPRAAWE